VEDCQAPNLTRLPLASTGGTPSGPEEELDSGEVRDRFPSFSPAGRRIAMCSRSRGPGVWILDLIPSSGTGYDFHKQIWARIFHIGHPMGDSWP
jgi:hypothetical protein